MKSFFGTIMDTIRNHKILSFTVGLMVALILGVVLYTTLRTPNDVAITEASKEAKEVTKETKKELKQESKGLSFDVPLAEEVKEFMGESEKLDGELSLTEHSDLILKEYGEEVLSSVTNGMLPSKNLTTAQNQLQLDKMKSAFTDSYVPPSTTAWEINNTDYIYEDATADVGSQSYRVNRGYLLENPSQFFNVGDITVGGFNVYTVKLSELTSEHVGLPTEGMENIEYDMSTINQMTPEDREALGDTDMSYIDALGAEENLTVVSYYVRPTKEMSTTKLLEAIDDLELQVNKATTMTPMKNDNMLKSNPMFGSAYTYLLGLDDKDVLSSSMYTVNQYISGNVLENRNTLSVNGNVSNLQVTSDTSAIDLTKSYTE